LAAHRREANPATIPARKQPPRERNTPRRPVPVTTDCTSASSTRQWSYRGRSAARDPRVRGRRRERIPFHLDPDAARQAGYRESSRADVFYCRRYRRRAWCRDLRHRGRGINFAMMVHGGQEFRMEAPSSPEDEIRDRRRVKSVEQESYGKGFYVFESVSTNQDGQRVGTAPGPTSCGGSETMGPRSSRGQQFPETEGHGRNKVLTSPLRGAHRRLQPDPPRRGVREGVGLPAGSSRALHHG